MDEIEKEIDELQERLACLVPRSCVDCRRPSSAAFDCLRPLSTVIDRLRQIGYSLKKKLSAGLSYKDFDYRVSYTKISKYVQKGIYFTKI